MPQDYETFDVANEDDELEEFLGLPRKHPKASRWWWNLAMTRWKYDL